MIEIIGNTPKTLNDVLNLEDEGQKINYLKKGRRSNIPDVQRLRKCWDPTLHDINDKSKYKDIHVLKNTAYDQFDDVSEKKVHIPPEYETKEPNRIALPIEQDQVNIHTAFTVGTEPKLDCNPFDDKESTVFNVLKAIFKDNKLKYQNRQIVRSWLSETDIAEYWYLEEDDNFWKKQWRKDHTVYGDKKPKYKLKSQIWSPFKGDKLYPFYDDSGKMVAFSREYDRTDLDGNKHTCFMTLTDSNIFVWDDVDGVWQMDKKRSGKHLFGKIPVLYAGREDALCDKITSERRRVEKCLSEYADCIDYHFFPILMLFGELDDKGVVSTDMRNRILKMTGEDAKAAYLTWNQSADPVKQEVETHLNEAYALTNTPRISFDQIKGTNALSGVAFRYVFMAIHGAVENHAEVLGPFFQRRVNFLLSAIGSVDSYLEEAAQSTDVETEIVPYMIDSVDDKVSTAVKAVSGGVWSTEHGVAYCSNYGETKDEVEQIMEDQQNKAAQSSKDDQKKDDQK
ncbi:MAG: phage portal protein [Prevotella sp.]|jgi:hypothetical protein|nr:phage portal protein [Prevotella sp.]MCI1474362.1 phage portal protein [Prevotella sp.]MCI1596082.1 phage portal protein [Prevotella sp.]